MAKGLGLQYISSLITTLCYFAIALTLAEFLGSSFVSFFKLEGSKYLSQIQGPLGFNIGFMIGLLVLNIGLIQMLATVSWENICQDLSAYHNLVNEMSFRKQILHMHISRSNYNPIMPTLQGSSYPDDALMNQNNPTLAGSEHISVPNQDIIQ